MRATRLAESPQQSLLGSLDKNKRRGILRAQLPQEGRELVELFALARIHQQRRALNFTAALHVQFAECRNQRDRKIIDTIKTEIFKCFEDGAFARAAESGKNHQLAGVARWSALHWAWPKPLPGAGVCLEFGDLRDISLRFGGSRGFPPPPVSLRLNHRGAGAAVLLRRSFSLPAGSCFAVTFLL